MVDKRHIVLEKTRRIMLLRRSNDFAIYSVATDSVIAAFPFYPVYAGDPEKRAREFFDYADVNGWR